MSKVGALFCILRLDDSFETCDDYFHQATEETVPLTETLEARSTGEGQALFFLNKMRCYYILHVIQTFVLINTFFLGHPNPPPPFPSTSDPHYDSASSCRETFSHLHNHSYFILFSMYVFVRKTLWLLVRVTLSEVTKMDLVTDFTNNW